MAEPNRNNQVYRKNLSDEPCSVTTRAWVAGFRQLPVDQVRAFGHSVAASPVDARAHAVCDALAPAQSRVHVADVWRPANAQPVADTLADRRTAGSTAAECNDSRNLGADIYTDQTLDFRSLPGIMIYNLKGYLLVNSPREVESQREARGSHCE